MTTGGEMIEEPARRRPVVGSVDVLVAGGGPAGFAAALSAARAGARVLLVERYGYLGGMMTGARVVWVVGAGNGNAPKARGVTLELQQRLGNLSAATALNKCGDYRIDPEVFKWQAVEMLSEAGAEVLVHTLVCDPILENGRVAGVFTESKNGRRAIRAEVTIDATADADVAFRAGCACDDQTHDVTLGILVNGIDRENVSAFEEAHPDEYRSVIAEAKRRNGGSLPEEGRCSKGINVSDAESLTRAEIQLRRECFDALAYLRANIPGYEEARVAETYPQIGVRMGRRVRGEYVVTDDDLRASRHFEDGIARLGAYLGGYELYGVAGLDYDIPFRCLVPEERDGLLVVGRCISCEYLACNSLRLLVPCLATGQAAGVAAAIAVRDRVEPRHASIKKLRTALLRQDVHL